MATKPYSRKQIMGHLQKLHDNWNGNYWLFAGDGTLHLMKKRKGDRILETSGGMSQKGIVATFHLIECDGGDW